MLFNSYEFIFIFLPMTFLIYFYLNAYKLVTIANAFLLFASLFFYSWWEVSYLFLILGSICFNFFLSKILTKKGNSYKKLFLLWGVIVNVVCLGYFKYSDFLISSTNDIFDTKFDLLRLALPLAISFFTFQQIAFLVDCYRGKIRCHGFLNYALFVSFFPQLIIGPIIRYTDMMPQFISLKNKALSFENISKGLFIFSIGLCKKTILADTFSIWATGGFDQTTVLNVLEAWAAVFSFYLQIYFDFSGYTDMAIGLALIFNIKISMNFNSPYKSLNIQDFWKRWHISLGDFLKDYVWSPLQKKNNSYAYINLIIVMLICGIWHGSGWTFLMFGLFHGIGLVIHQIWLKAGLRIFPWVSWLITFVFINISIVLFRARDWSSALKIYKGMLNMTTNNPFNESILTKLYNLSQHGIRLDEWKPFWVWAPFCDDYSGGDILIPFLFIGFILILFFDNSNQQLNKFKPCFKNLFFTTILLASSILAIAREEIFVYFKF